jgi:hypothetical protein
MSTDVGFFLCNKEDKSCKAASLWQDGGTCSWILESFRMGLGFEYDRVSLSELRSFFLDFFSSISKEKIEKMVEVLMKDVKWDKAEAVESVITFLHDIKPIISELKENDKSFIFLLINGEYVPEEAKEELKALSISEDMLYEIS